MSIVSSIYADSANALKKEWTDALEKILYSLECGNYGPKEKLMEIAKVVEKMKAYYFSE